MAEGVRIACDNCGHAVEAWSDGNPYYIDEAGTKQYAYHPDHERLARCVGNDVPHLCLSCGHEFVSDTRDPMAACPECRESEISSTFELAGKRCPRCEGGVFRIDPEFHVIS